MPQSQSPEAYGSARALLDRALHSPKGIRVPFESPGRAFSMMMQCYTVRSRARGQSIEVYAKGDPQYNRTPYDELSLHREDHEGNYIPSTQRGSGHILVIAKPQELNVEEL